MARRSLPELNAGSMADIAFLLLIFFLVSTTFLNEKGVKATLPQYYVGPPGPASERNVLDIKVNKLNQLLVEEQVISIRDLSEVIKDFVDNPNRDMDKPLAPSRAIISIQHDMETKYQTYLEVYSIIRGSYNDLREAMAKNIFNKTYEQLSIAQRNQIITVYPIKISEADPVNF